MSITHRLVRFDQKRVCAMGLVFTLQHEFELAMLHSITYNGHVGGLCSEEFEDTNWIIRIHQSKNTMVKRKNTKGQTTIYKAYT